MPKLFRFKALIPFAVIGGLLVCFYLFFLDGFIKRGVIAAAETANGAKVEIDHFDLQLFNSAVITQNIRVTDKKKPMKNLFEIGELSFDMDSNYLSHGKLMVELMTLTGLAFGTDRTTSGALKSVASKQASSTTPQKKPINTALVGDIDYKSIIHKANIPIVNKAKAVEKLVKEKFTFWENRLKTVSDLKDVEQAVKTVQSIDVNSYKTIQDIPRAQKDIDRIQNAIKVINAKKEELKQVKVALNKDKSLLKKEYQSLNRMINTGVKGMIFPGGSNEGLAKALLALLFGDSMAKKGIFLLNQYETYKGFIPEKKADDPKEDTPVKQQKGSMLILSMQGMCQNMW